MKLKLFFVLISLYTSSFGQTNTEQQKYIDSLQYVIDTVQKDSLSIATRYKLGNYYFKKTRNFSSATEEFFKVLELTKNTDYKELEAMAYDRLAWMESRKNNDKKALEYMEKACEYYRVSDSKKNADYHDFIASYNLGSMLSEVSQMEKAEIHLKAALQKAIKYNKENWILNSYAALGNIYTKLQNDKMALKYFLQAAKTLQKAYGTYGNGRTPSSIAELYAKLGDFENADLWLARAEECVNRRNDFLHFKEFYYTKFQVKKLEGDAEAAIESYEQFSRYKDSIFNSKVMEKTTQLEEQYTSELKEMEEQKKATEEKLAQTEMEKAKQRTTWMTIFIVVMIIALIITIYRIKITIQKNKIIASQKAEVDEKNREILDSITYARRIQKAIMPSNQVIEKVLPNSFVLYKPKDVVAGDFYWLEEINDTILFAAADCTGHGVPGAMVSVVCHNAMNRSVREFGLMQPSKILDQTREIVQNELSKSEDGMKDGMDIALCSLNNLQLKYSGANNPLWIVRNGEIIEYAPNKQPIGQFDNPVPFTNHEINLRVHDSIYVFSDGYIDQFGGEKDRKFGKKRLKDLLLTIQDKSMTEQKSILDEKIMQWMKGTTLGQLDDICVLGIKV